MSMQNSDDYRAGYMAGLAAAKAPLVSGECHWCGEQRQDIESGNPAGEPVCRRCLSAERSKGWNFDSADEYAGFWAGFGAGASQ